MGAENRVLEYVMADGSSWDRVPPWMPHVWKKVLKTMEVAKELDLSGIHNDSRILIDEYSKTLLPQITSHPNWSQCHVTTVVPIRVILERLLERVSWEQKLRIQIVNKTRQDSLVYIDQHLDNFSMEGLQVTLERMEDNHVIEWWVIGIIPDMEDGVIYFQSDR